MSNISVSPHKCSFRLMPKIFHRCILAESLPRRVEVVTFSYKSWLHLELVVIKALVGVMCSFVYIVHLK